MKRQRREMYSMADMVEAVEDDNGEEDKGKEKGKNGKQKRKGKGMISMASLDLWCSLKCVVLVFIGLRYRS
ncbi:unnamed protein product [Lactuca virosa]|uniref:Uncharacterized protein n=1 Tax=Lactuca virosa TaxID=75947 RepID=A0AAU9PFR8_9ASTR|nr:unnamed protein product [Lactuca virosa]